MGRCIVENVFDILKGNFRELWQSAKIHVTIILDMDIAYCLLHNLLLGQSLEEVDQLLESIYQEGEAIKVDGDLKHKPSSGPLNMDF